MTSLRMGQNAIREEAANPGDRCGPELARVSLQSRLSAPFKEIES